MDCVLAFDLGTSSVKASLFSEDGSEIRSLVKTYPSFTKAGNISEQRPEDWWQTVCSLSSQLYTGDYSVHAIALSGHSMGVIPVAKDGSLLLQSVPIWNDSRAVHEAELFFREENRSRWYSNTGCGLTPQLYPLFKLAWMKANLPQVYNQAFCFLGTKDYINMKMTGRMCTEHSDASGSGAYSLHTHTRIPEYYDILSLDISKMPEILHSTDVIGTLTPHAAKLMGLPSGIKIISGGVDNACMCLGAGCWRKNQAYASLGTSAWIAAASDSPELDEQKGIYTFAHCVDGLYIPAVGVLSAGSSQTWVMHQLLGISDDFSMLESFAQKSPAGANGVIFIPTLAGGNGIAPSMNMKGGFMNLSLDISRADLCRSVYEGISCELALCYDSLRSRIPLSAPLLITGGGAKSDFWMNMIAQIFGTSVCTAQNARSTAAYGAAALALTGCGIRKDFSFMENRVRTVFPVNECEKENFSKLRSRFWKAMLAQSSMYEE